MKIIEIPIKDLNQIIISMIVFFVAMALVMICNFNFTRNKIKNIQMNRF
jgi:hypothetical protein